MIGIALGVMCCVTEGLNMLDSCERMVLSWDGKIKAQCGRLDGSLLKTEMDLANCYANYDGNFVATKG